MNQLVLEKVQWSTLTDIDDVEPLGQHDFEVLEEIKGVLARHGLTHRFGICLLHRHFDLAENEIAVEETDIANRVSQVTVRRASEVTGPILDTTWRFKADGTGSFITYCEAKCVLSDGHKFLHHLIKKPKPEEPKPEKALPSKT